MAICPSKNSLRPDFLSIFDQIARLVAGRVAYFSRLPIAQAYSSYVKITLSSGGKIDQFFVAAPDATAANFEGAKPQCIRPGTRVQKKSMGSSAVSARGRRAFRPERCGAPAAAAARPRRSKRRPEPPAPPPPPAGCASASHYQNIPAILLRHDWTFCVESRF